MSLSVQKVKKSYEGTEALKGVSLEVAPGSIFGLLGPNGAGKTTLIRIITQIIKADVGQVLWHNSPITLNTAALFGYMPEERGLYPRMKVGEQLEYLACLKGLSRSAAQEKMDVWLDKFSLMERKNSKVNELSKGMQQKIQFITTVMHEPGLIILDEPFSGLDPVNTELIKDEISALRDKGVAVIFSTHRMEQVEEICEQIALVNKGEVILSGQVNEIKQRYKRNLFIVEYQGQVDWPAMQGVTIIKDEPGQAWITMDNEDMLNNVLGRVMAGARLLGLREKLPSLNEIFIEQVKGESHE